MTEQGNKGDALHSMVHRLEDKVYRPSGYWSYSVHQLLMHLKKEKFDSAPRALGFDTEGNEILSYVTGDVYNYPLVGAIASTEALCSAAELLRDYHDATASFVQSDQFGTLRWLLPNREPREVVCHGDYAPYNVALNGSKVVGVFDFDTAHPAPRVWDVAYAVYCWAPFKTNSSDSLGDLAEQTMRARLFCDAYGLLHEDRVCLVETMISRIQTLVEFMHEQAAKGHEGFIANLKDGHDVAYIADIEYLRCHKKPITDYLILSADHSTHR